MSKTAAKSKNQPEESAVRPTARPTAKVAVTLHGREYVVACDVGDEKKLTDIVKLVDAKLCDISGKSSNATETRLFMLTCLMLADELIETRRAAKAFHKADEDLMVAAVEHLRDRVMNISQQIGRA